MKLVVKKNNSERFLLDLPSSTETDKLIEEICSKDAKLLKLERLCDEIKSLAEHGILIAPQMQGLTADQVRELKLVDEYENICIPQGGFNLHPDEIGRRNGKAPNESMKRVLEKSIDQVKGFISKSNISNNVNLTEDILEECIRTLRGAVTIVYPMNIPPYDPIYQEFENNEDLEGRVAANEIINTKEASLWFCGKEIIRGKSLSDYAGCNEKTKIVVKLSKKGKGPPSREPVVSEEEQKAMMSYYHKRQQEIKKIEEDFQDLSYLDSTWADSQNLKRHFHGLNDVKWKA